jgi:hypothetical protein
MDEEQYKKLFKGSAIKRAGYSGLKRTLHYLSNEDKPQ